MIGFVIIFQRLTDRSFDRGRFILVLALSPHSFVRLLHGETQSTSQGLLDKVTRLHKFSVNSLNKISIFFDLFDILFKELR